MEKIKASPCSTILLLILSMVYINVNCYPLYIKHETGSSYTYVELLDVIFQFTPQKLELLEQNKFIVLNRMTHDDLQAIYKFY
jgi:hypothetical protein